MKYRFLPRLLSMFAVWLLLVSWQRVAVTIGDLGNLLFVALMTVPLAMSGLEAALYRRHAFREQYLMPGGWLHRVTGWVPLLLFAEIGKALLLALVLMGATLALQVRDWALLLLVALVLTFLMPRLPGLLRGTVNDTYLYPLARRWAVWFATLLLWSESVLVLLLVEDNDYRNLAWDEAIGYSLALPVGDGAHGLVALMRHVDAGVSGAGAWARDQLVQGGADLATTLVAVMALLAVAGIWFLVAWTFARALVGVTARPRGVWSPRARPNAGHYEPWWY